MSSASRSSGPSRPTRFRPAVLLLLLLLSALLLVVDDSAGAQAWNGPLGPEWDSGGWAAEYGPRTIGVPHYSGDIGLCTTRGAGAVLEGIEPARTVGSVRLDGAFMRAPAASVDASVGRRSSDPDFNGYVVDQPCDGVTLLPSVGFRVTRLSEGHAGVEGIVIRYRVNGYPYRYLSHFSIGLCDPDYDGAVGVTEICGSNGSEPPADPSSTGPLRPMVLGPLGSGGSRGAQVAEPVVLETGTLCMSEPGTAVLDRIEPRTLGQLRIDRIGIRPANAPEPPLDLGLETAPPETLDGRYRPVAGGQVIGGCASSSAVVVGIQASRVGPGDARILGFDLVYHVGEQSYRFRTNSSLTLCDPDPRTHLRLAGCGPFG